MGHVLFTQCNSILKCMYFESKIQCPVCSEMAGQSGILLKIFSLDGLHGENCGTSSLVFLL